MEVGDRYNFTVLGSVRTGVVIDVDGASVSLWDETTGGIVEVPIHSLIAVGAWSITPPAVSKEKPSTPTTYYTHGAPATQSKASYVGQPWASHKHALVPYQIKEFNLYLSSAGRLSASDITGSGVLTDTFFALDKSPLAPDDFYTNSSKVKMFEDESPWCATVYVPWPDMGRITVPVLHRLVRTVEAELVQQKVVEIGCIGGHGRTGTLVAAITMYMTGKTAKKAITHLRAHYCTSAVESKSQVELLAEYQVQLQGGNVKDILKTIESGSKSGSSASTTASPTTTKVSSYHGGNQFDNSMWGGD